MTAPNQQFDSARLKINWAKRHIYKLVDEYCALLEMDLTRPVIESNAKTGNHHIKIIPIADFPTGIPLIVGDAVHNLRTAFDHIAVAITGKDWIAMPIGKTRDDIIAKSGHYRTINEMSSKLALFILDEIEPYRGGRFKLWEISELDRIDKHRLIIPTINQPYRMGVKVENERGKTFSSPWFTVGETVIEGTGPFKINDEGHSAIGITFGPGTPLEDEPVLETLDGLSELALKAVEAFEEFYFR